MGSDMFVNYMAIEAERKMLDARASRGWQAEQAGAGHHRSRFIQKALQQGATVVGRTRWSAGTILLRAGTRPRGMPGLDIQLERSV